MRQYLVTKGADGNRVRGAENFSRMSRWARGIDSVVTAAKLALLPHRWLEIIPCPRGLLLGLAPQWVPSAETIVYRNGFDSIYTAS